MGTLREMKEELSRNTQGETTIAEFADVYLNEYCQFRNSDLTFKRQNLKAIVRILGEVPLVRVRRSHAHEFVVQRSREVAPATVNRGLAVLKNLLTYALDKGVIDAHPLIRFHLLPEEQRALRVLTLEEERQLVQAVAEADPVIGAYVALLGETGFRKSEGLKLKWSQIDRSGRLVAVEKTKNKRARYGYVPLSDFALKWIDPLVRLIHCPYVFVNLKTGRPWLDPRGPFEQGNKAERDSIGWGFMI